VVALRAELQHAAAEEVELDGHLCAEGAVPAHCGALVRREDAEGVAAEVEDGAEDGAAERLQALQRDLPLLAQINIVLPARGTNGV
jgi:hypothetical protein